MGLFGLERKKESGKNCGCEQEKKSACTCGNQSPGNNTKSARFIVLGACCEKSAATLANVKQAVAELGFADEVLNLGDAVEIASYGVLQTPALVVNGKIVSMGRLLKAEDAKRLISDAGVQP